MSELETRLLRLLETEELNHRLPYTQEEIVDAFHVVADVAAAAVIGKLKSGSLRRSKTKPKRYDQALSAKEAAERLGIGRTKLRDETKAGRIVAKTIGRKKVYLESEIDRYLNEAPPA